MLRFDCVHLKKVTNDDILQNYRGSMKCHVDWAIPDSSNHAGIVCPEKCPRLHPKPSRDGTSAFSAIKEAFLSLIGKS
jgi:hypothetical protein